MGLAKFLLVVAVLLALAGYALYTPIPEGYSPASTRRLQVVLGFMKIIDCVAHTGSFLGVRSYVDVHRSISNFLVGRMAAHPDPDVKETDADFDGVPVRVYELINRPKTPMPAVVFYHGGGWTFGNFDMMSNLVRRLCKETNTVVVSVEYVATVTSTEHCLVLTF
jgi:acetyl esterase/lipase